MSFDLIRVVTAAQQLDVLKKFNEAKYWTMTHGDRKDQPVEQVVWSLKEITTLDGRFRFSEDGKEHTLNLFQDLLSRDDEGVTYDKTCAEMPHVSVKATTHGLTEMAVIVKSAFTCDGETKQYRFDCHMPWSELGVLIDRI